MSGDRSAPRQVLKGLLRTVSVAALVLCGLAAAPDRALAQQAEANPIADIAASRARSPDERMLVEAAEVLYDYDRETVSAVGNVVIYYGGDVLQADRVVYNRATSRVRAIGNVKLTERDGNVLYAEDLELADDFSAGFVNSLQIQRPDNSRFAAARAIRTGDRITVLERGVYTACEVCEDKPEKPPLWRVRAARIIHDQQERMVYYEDAQLEFFGVPVAYLPFLQHPDPTVKRKSGFLAPTYIASSELGIGAEIPFFWNIAPNMDLTVAPVILSRQGLMMKGEFRHRLVNGAYSVRAAGIFQQDRGAFPHRSGKEGDDPRFVIGAGDETFRGVVETDGLFAINERWSFGWDITAVTDKWVLDDYNLWDGNRKEAISTVHLTGLGDRSYFDLRGYYFMGLNADDRQKELPTVLPQLDYSKILDGPVLGGELGFNVNLTALRRLDSDFEPLGDSNFGRETAPGNFDCDSFDSDCIARGIGGNYTRLSADMQWRREIIDPIGQVWAPFAFMRADFIWQDPNDTRGVDAFLNTESQAFARGMAGGGVEYRYPLVASNASGTHIIEPIAQFIVRPDEQRIGESPNEDAQSLMFDDTTLFEWDKFSGWDRVEGGGRLNAGLQYTWTMPTGAFINVLVGQSYHLFGINSFAELDTVNTGLESGLESSRSDYVARLFVQASPNLALSTRFRFDEDTFEARTTELQATFRQGPLQGNVLYGRYEERPRIGFGDTQEGILGSAKLDVTENWFLTAGARYDIDTERFDRTQLGIGYLDECFDMRITYSNSLERDGNKDPVHEVLFRLSLRTLGGGAFRTSLSGEEVDGGPTL